VRVGEAQNDQWGWGSNLAWVRKGGKSRGVPAYTESGVGGGVRKLKPSKAFKAKITSKTYFGKKRSAGSRQKRDSQGKKKSGRENNLGNISASIFEKKQTRTVSKVAEKNTYEGARGGRTRLVQ